MEVSAMNSNAAMQYAPPVPEMPQRASAAEANPARETMRRNVEAPASARVDEQRANERPRPVVNVQGQMTGRIVNTSA